MMTSAQVVETSVNVTSNSPSQDYTHPDDHNLPNYDMTPGFKPFTVLLKLLQYSDQEEALFPLKDESLHKNLNNLSRNQIRYSYFN